MTKKNTKSNRSETRGNNDVIHNTSCTGKGIQYQMTHGSIKKTFMPQNLFKPSIPTLLRLDKQRYKRQPIEPTRFSSSSHTTMSQRSSPELEYLRPRSPTPQLAIHNGGPITSLSEQELAEEHAAVRNSTAQVAYHASLIPRTQNLFNAPLSEVLQAFGDTPPTRTSSPHNPTLHDPRPSHGAIELSPSPEPIPMPLLVHNTTLLPPYTRDDTPLLSTPSSEGETLVDADDHPGPGWHINYDHQGIRYMFTMPGSDPDIQEVTKYLQIDMNGGDPILCATMGRGLLVHRVPSMPSPERPLDRRLPNKSYSSSEEERATPPW
jgi:hypothetical protein